MSEKFFQMQGITWRTDATVQEMLPDGVVLERSFGKRSTNGASHMAQIELSWIGQHRFLGVDSTGHTVVLSPGADIGVKPAETLLIALAACTAHDVVEILHKQRARLEELLIRVVGDQAAKPPWAYERIHLSFQITAAGVRLAQLERAVDLALNKYCSVRASLAPEIAVTFAAELRTPSMAG